MGGDENRRWVQGAKVNSGGGLGLRLRLQISVQSRLSSWKSIVVSQ